jgi:hypothetical protein
MLWKYLNWKKNWVDSFEEFCQNYYCKRSDFLNVLDEKQIASSGLLGLVSQ